MTIPKFAACVNTMAKKNGRGLRSGSVRPLQNKPYYSTGNSRSKLLAGTRSENFAPAVKNTAGVGIPFLPVAVMSQTVPALSKTYVPARWRVSAVFISAPSGTAETSAEIAFLKLNPKPRKISAEGNPCFCPPDISAKWMSAVNSG